MSTTGSERGKGLGSRTWAALGALGVLGALGAGAVTFLAESGREAFVVPIQVDVTVRTSNPNFAFSAEVDPALAPMSPDGQVTDEFLDWAERMGGVAYGDQYLELVIRGRDESPVVIGDVAVRVVERGPPVGQWVNGWDGCGAGVPVRLLMVDLGPDPPDVKLLVDGQETDRAVFQVSETEAEVFDVDVLAGDDVVSWVLDIRYTSDGRDGTYTVESPSGEPFRLAGGGTPLVYADDYASAQAVLVPDEEATRLLHREGAVC